MSERLLDAPPRVSDFGLAPPRSVVARRHAPRDYAQRRLLAAADVAGLAIGLVTALLVSGREDVGGLLSWSALTLPAWVVIFKAYGLYDRDIKRTSHTTLDDVPWLFHALLLGSLLLWGWYHLVPVVDLRFAEILGFAGVSAVAVLALRGAARRAVAAALGPERVLLIGDGETVGTLARKMRAHPEYGLEPIGLITTPGSPATRAGLPVVGDLGDLDFPSLIPLLRVDRIVVSHVDVEEPELLDVLRHCKGLSIKVGVLPQLFDAMGPSVEVDDVEGLTVIGINPPVLPRSSRAMKRTMDIAGAGALLVLTAPLLAAVAVCVKLDSRGPVLFKQERVGKGGRRFRLVKFRTMIVDAEQMTDELRTQSRDPGWLLIDHDPRVTRVGRFLRHSSLDELPQLWNVLRGQMSLVGPRPLIESEDRQLEGWARSRIDLTPGLTGLWQVLGRTSIPFEEMVKLDYLYVTNWSLWTDVRLLLRTLPAVLVRRGVN